MIWNKKTEFSDYIKSVRPYMKWGTFGKSGKDPLTYKLVDDLESEHIENILYNGGISEEYQTAFKQILIERENK